jgi:hypothetical protein
VLGGSKNMEFAVWLAEIHPCAFVAPASVPLEVDEVNGPDHVLNNITPSLKRLANLVRAERVYDSLRFGLLIEPGNGRTGCGGSVSINGITICAH